MKVLSTLVILCLLKACNEPFVPRTLLEKSPEKENIENELRIKNKPKFTEHKTIQTAGIIEEKTFFIEDDFYELHFTYPYLNGNNNTSFNEYINDNYLNIESITNQILDDKEMQCNNHSEMCGKDKKVLEYKIHMLSEKVASIILFQENFYSGSAYSSYKFDCMNFLLNENKFLKFNDVFVEGSENKIFKKLNEKIRSSINKGNIYFDCWEISQNDFRAYQNNFVMDEYNIVYYFDDCIICPAFTGTYSIELSRTEIKHLLKIENNLTI